MTDSLPTEVTVFTDVNVLAIALTDDHPVHEDVYPWIQDAIDGPTYYSYLITTRCEHST